MFAVPAKIVAEVAWESLEHISRSGGSAFWAGFCFGKLAALKSIEPDNIYLQSKANEAEFLVTNYFYRHGIIK